MFHGRELLTIGKRLDRAAKEPAADAAAPTVQQRTDAVEEENQRLREMRRRPSSR